MRKQKHTLLLCIICCSFIISCIKVEETKINKNREQNELMAHIRFIASDELKGRKPGTKEAKISARYIAEQFRASGLKKFSRFQGYLQPTVLKIDKNTKFNQTVFCNNVVGYIEGSDPKLKGEYLLLMAHYDHLGTKRDILNSNTDSIYNGARDNGMGVVALIHAAKQLALSSPKRSIIFLATTGEEEGMLGSDYFAEHCPVSLHDIVFVINNDGGGYNDTTLIRIAGKNSIDFPSHLWSDLKNFGIESMPYPSELEYLYEKGDNITFARKGIPSITISPGFDKIDDEILKYIHKPADEADDNFNYSYLLKFSQVYAEIARVISNMNVVPCWKDDVKYNKPGIGSHDVSKTNGK